MATLLAVLLNALTASRKTKRRIRPTPVSALPNNITVVPPSGTWLWPTRSEEGDVRNALDWIVECC